MKVYADNNVVSALPDTRAGRPRWPGGRTNPPSKFFV